MMINLVEEVDFLTQHVLLAWAYACKVLRMWAGPCYPLGLARLYLFV